MELQELTTDELISIEGGSLLYDIFYTAFRAIRHSGDLANSLEDNPNFGNAVMYK